jgi:hypothetical protein
VRSKDYGADVLAAGRRREQPPPVDAEVGLVVEDAGTGFCGAVVVVDRGAMTLEDRHGNRRVFPYGVYLVDGVRADVRRPRPSSPIRPARTASGSIAVSGAPARVARASRILVEGRHDAELVETVWGDDLRAEGVVVEMLDGADHLADVVRDFRPRPQARLGVLLDHMVAGSKEARIAASVASEHVLVVGHPFVDIWQAVKPARVGLSAWPVVPVGRPWKETVAAHLGEPDVATAWRRIRAAARSWTDLEPQLLAPMEALIDFVTA